MALTAPPSTSPEHIKTLNANQAIMDALGASATPAIYYMNTNQELQQVAGLPDNAQLESMMGSQ